MQLCPIVKCIILLNTVPQDSTYPTTQLLWKLKQEEWSGMYGSLGQCSIPEKQNCIQVTVIRTDFDQSLIKITIVKRIQLELNSILHLKGRMK